MKFTKAYLQTLSTHALFKLADQYGLFLSDDLARHLLIGELLELEDERSDDEDTPDVSAVSHQTSAVYSYNLTEIRAILRDPLWFFVFWDFHKRLFVELTESKDFDSFVLRIHSLDPETASRSLDFFDVQVPLTDRSRYVHVSFDEYLHRVELIARFSDGHEQHLAQSNIVRMLRKNIPQQLCVSQNAVHKVISLSGLSALKKSHFQHYRQAFR